MSILQKVEHTNRCGIYDQHAASYHSAMAVAQAVIHDWHPI
ncbi:MAG: hypothetical protein WA172_00175 [Terriglobales bacterium]